MLEQAKELHQSPCHPEEAKKAKKDKKRKADRLRKILKERLNIDCLRMLTTQQESQGDDEEELGDVPVQPYEVNEEWAMMRELDDDNNVVPQEQAPKLDSFSEIYSVRDLLGFGGFGVVLLVKNKKTDEKSALKIINKE
jgi:hypothetical protein